MECSMRCWALGHKLWSIRDPSRAKMMLSECLNNGVSGSVVPRCTRLTPHSRCKAEPQPPEREEGFHFILRQFPLHSSLPWETHLPNSIHTHKPDFPTFTASFAQNPSAPGRPVCPGNSIPGSCSYALQLGTGAGVQIRIMQCQLPLPTTLVKCHLVITCVLLTLSLRQLAVSQMT